MAISAPLTLYPFPFIRIILIRDVRLFTLYRFAPTLTLKPTDSSPQRSQADSGRTPLKSVEKIGALWWTHRGSNSTELRRKLVCPLAVRGGSVDPPPRGNPPQKFESLRCGLEPAADFLVRRGLKAKPGGIKTRGGFFGGRKSAADFSKIMRKFCYGLLRHTSAMGSKNYQKSHLSSQLW